MLNLIELHKGAARNWQPFGFYVAHVQIAAGGLGGQGDLWCPPGKPSKNVTLALPVEPFDM